MKRAIEKTALGLLLATRCAAGYQEESILNIEDPPAQHTEPVFPEYASVLFDLGESLLCHMAREEHMDDGQTTWSRLDELGRLRRLFTLNRDFEQVVEEIIKIGTESGLTQETIDRALEELRQTYYDCPPASADEHQTDDERFRVPVG